jgi:hypothetical protein
MTVGSDHINERGIYEGIVNVPTISIVQSERRAESVRVTCIVGGGALRAVGLGLASLTCRQGLRQLVEGVGQQLQTSVRMHAAAVHEQLASFYPRLVSNGW